MRLAIISDVHANEEALTEAFRTIADRGADEIYCLGDIVGYGASPAACIHMIQEHCSGFVQGNHDLAVATGIGLTDFPPDGRVAAEMHRAMLDRASLEWLAALPLKIDAHGCTFVHASPSEPRAWNRLSSPRTAAKQFDHFDSAVCFIGHTHIPAVMADRLGVLRVREGHRFLINVGSVGQPRDGNPRACIAFFDTLQFTYDLVRSPYDVERAASRIVDVGLPRSLARRLPAAK